MEHEGSINLPPLRLKASVEAQDAQHLALRYTLTNPLAQRIYLFAPPLDFGTHTEFELLEESAWVFQEGDHGVRLVRAVLRTPPGLMVAARLPTAVVPVEPDASCTGRIVLPLPLVESHPYQPSAAKDVGTLYSVHQARLQMGWVEARENMKFRSRPLPNGTTLLTLEGNWGMPFQRVVEVVLPIAGVSLRRNPDPSFNRPNVPTQ